MTVNYGRCDPRLLKSATSNLGDTQRGRESGKEDRRGNDDVAARDQTQFVGHYSSARGTNPDARADQTGFTHPDEM
jgi:hypothetical protein